MEFIKKKNGSVMSCNQWSVEFDELATSKILKYLLKCSLIPEELEPLKINTSSNIIIFDDMHLIINDDIYIIPESDIVDAVNVLQTKQTNH